MTAVAGQLPLELLELLELCDYGQPKMGEVRPCSKRATHAAHWFIPATYRDGTPNSRAGEGHIDCCREHADYYASAWAYGPCRLYPAMTDSAWIEILG